MRVRVSLCDCMCVCVRACVRVSVCGGVQGGRGGGGGGTVCVCAVSTPTLVVSLQRRL